MICQGTVDEIMDRISGTHPIAITVLNKQEDAIKILKENTNVGKIDINENKITAAFNGDDNECSELLKKLVIQNIPIVSFNREASSLEDIFIKITEKEELKEES